MTEVITLEPAESRPFLCFLCGHTNMADDARHYTMYDTGAEKTYTTILTWLNQHQFGADGDNRIDLAMELADQVDPDASGGADFHAVCPDCATSTKKQLRERITNRVTVLLGAGFADWDGTGDEDLADPTFMAQGRYLVRYLGAEIHMATPTTQEK